MSIKKVLAVVSIVLFGLAGRSTAQAQIDEHRMEIGGHYTALRLTDFDATQSGIGGRLTYNINDYLAVEAEGNFFPEDHFGNSAIDQQAQGLIGVKAGARHRRFGIFGKVRPGVVNFPSLKNFGGICVPSDFSLSCDRSSRSGNRFALDIGGVLEVYPSKRTIIRVDLGDTMIRFKGDRFFTTQTPVRLPDGFNHNFQLTVGFGYRF